MKLRRIALLSACLLASLPAAAQFYSAGDDPGRFKWYSISSPHFEIIYPAGADSLARAYGERLEHWRAPLGLSIGYAPGETFRRPSPVVLHINTADANGMAMWTPHRMDLYTGPDGLEPESTDWVSNLTIHESRHVSQMQFTRHRRFTPLTVLTGELFGGACSVLYPGLALMEGDAVSMETALTPSGRGRSADFLEYYRSCFDEGQFRDWYRWRWGSQKCYTPDYYRAGYMLVAGIRYVYDDALFMKRYYDNIFSRKLPLPLLNLQYTVEQASGMGLQDTWRQIVSTQWDLWLRDEEERGPFAPARQLTSYGRRFEEYTGVTLAGDDIYAIRSGITHTPELVRVSPDGEACRIRSMSHTTSDLAWSEPLGRIVWSETAPDPRWTLAGTSRIMTLEPGSRRITMLTKQGRLYNPAPSHSDSRIAAGEYPLYGGSATVIIDGNDGHVIERLAAPDSLQVVQPAWIGDEVVVSAISPAGFGIYNASRGYETLLSPQPPKIKELSGDGDSLMFVSDRLGVNELYSIRDGQVRQLSNTRRGAIYFSFQQDSVVFSALTSDGRMLYKAPRDSSRIVDYSERCLYPMAERLAAQEDSLSRGLTAAEGAFGEPVPYRKAAHLLRLHSWAPAYVDYDSISSMSFDNLFSAAGLGATAFFQNDLGTFSGYVGYSAARTREDELSIAQWRHSAHADFTYTGLYPVIEMSADIGERDARQYHLVSTVFTSRRSAQLTANKLYTPYVKSTVKVYVPLRYRKGGWVSGVIPQVNINFSNDFINTTDVLRQYIATSGSSTYVLTPFAGTVPGHNVPLMRATASIRGYSMLGVADSGIYPRWGIGAEAGYSFRPLLGNLFTPAAYTYLYGYVPGLLDTHGIRMTLTTQLRLDGRLGESYLKCLPRGLNAVSGAQDYIQARYPVQDKFTFDYALPVFPVDWSGLGPLAYVRNFEITAHADACLYNGNSSLSAGSLYSVGADFTVRLANLIWVPFDTRIGVSYNYSGGSSWDDMTKNGLSLERHRVSMVFTVEM